MGLSSLYTVLAFGRLLGELPLKPPDGIAAVEKLCYQTNIARYSS